jgi:hypothetical protein
MRRNDLMIDITVAPILLSRGILTKPSGLNFNSKLNPKTLEAKLGYK